MSVVVRFEGSDRLVAVGRGFRDAGRDGSKSIKRETLKGLHRASFPLRKAAKREARSILPKGGGLNKRVQSSRMSTRVRFLGRDPSVRIEAKGMQQLEMIDRGWVNHLTFGHLPWTVSPVPSGWFTRPMQQGLPLVREEISRSLDEVKRAIDAL